MKVFATVLVVVVLLAGCVTYYKPVPDGHKGPVAVIRDTVRAHSASKADFFYLSHVDEQVIEQSATRTRIANHGRGFQMNPVWVQREVPIREFTLTIVGRTEYAAPILALTNTVYQVKGDVRFTPQAGRVYEIRGELGESYSAVWVEEDGKGVVPGTKVEVKGSAKLGIFER